MLNQYANDLKVFALRLHFNSPDAYKYVRKRFKTCLPHPRTISGWYRSVNVEPGFTFKAFEAPRLKSNSSHKKPIYGLILDAMAIRQHEEWDPDQGKAYGYADMGTGMKENNLTKYLYFWWIVLMDTGKFQ